ncbi:hypothetical protein [Psychroserpens algicola]|uniref:YD repeat-containing protein n=1 Tax=Psychroserpens algicola TaxID=1719034 RepID=A0ABT0HCZ8_9FLAO|nr:hypothetical protein [Psychroserpens algicola]MCK8482233.1 hypothetical protein [Psychroserpens algicola]
MKNQITTLLLLMSFISYAQDFRKERRPDDNVIILPTNPSNRFNCSSFYPLESKEYIVSAWVKEDVSNVPTYSNNVYLQIEFTDENGTQTVSLDQFYVSGKIIDGWQRIIGKFSAPTSSQTQMNIELVNDNLSKDAYFDDVRIFPYNGTLKSFVYDETNQRLMAELDENNYATYYEYDLEGGLIRVKKETEKGVYTIQETRSGNAKSENDGN